MVLETHPRGLVCLEASFSHFKIQKTNTKKVRINYASPAEIVKVPNVIEQASVVIPVHLIYY